MSKYKKGDKLYRAELHCFDDEPTLLVREYEVTHAAKTYRVEPQLAFKTVLSDKDLDTLRPTPEEAVEHAIKCCDREMERAHSAYHQAVADCDEIRAAAVKVITCAEQKQKEKEAWAKLKNASIPR